MGDLKKEFDMATARSATPGYNASQITALASALPPAIALLIKGTTGVGKSAITHELGSVLNFPVLDIRLSLRNEGDMIGLPDQRASQERGVTCFAPPAWLMRACNEPVILFLDEFNRAEKQVQNAAFQLVLDRQLGESPDGTPYHLHPDTRIIAAINEGFEYSGISEMDAALMRRFFCVEFVADFADWRKWAAAETVSPTGVKASRVDRLILEFLSENVSHWNADLSKVVPGSVFPTPATWHRLSDTLRYMNEAPSSIAGQAMSDVAFYVSCSAVGTSAAAGLRNYIKNAVQNVTAEEIFDPSLNKSERKKLLSLVKKGGVETQILVVEQFESEQGLVHWLRTKRITPDFALDVCRELVNTVEGELQNKIPRKFLEAVAVCRTDLGLAGEEFQKVLMAGSSLMREVTSRAVKG